MEEVDSAFLDEILQKSFEYLGASDLIRISLVCKQWLRVSRAPELWKRHVLKKWPSQRFLYESINARALEWLNIYQELEQKSWFSPDDMKYFICCKTFWDEPVTEEVRRKMFEQMNHVSYKWMQVFPFEHDDNNYAFDKNAELYYDTSKLKWVFLDRRRGYIGDLFPSQKLKAVRKNKKIRHIRPYQVIPSCLVLYRWLCLFRSFASAEDGLTFYRIWRFKLKHRDTGMVFEIYDWKAAMNTTFSNGMPADAAFRDDAMELLDLLTHPHFVMHPLGSQPVLNVFDPYFACASAGGATRWQASRHTTPRKKLRRKSPGCKEVKSCDDGKHFKAICDSDDEIQQGREKRMVRRKVSPKPQNTISPLSPRASASSVHSCERPSLSRQSSQNSTLSDTEGSERESDFESECENPEFGYVVNCEYFIIGAHSLDIEEQHSIQASISDGWMVTHKTRVFTVQVHYNAIDGVWYFSNENSIESSLAGAAIALRDLQPISPKITPLPARSQSDNVLQLDSKLHMGISRRPNSSTNIRTFSPEQKPHSDSLLSPPLSPMMSAMTKDASGSQNSVSSITSTTLSSKLNFEVDTEDEILQPLETMPSCLALYRLICLFDLNCSMYKSLDDTCAWSVKMLHKKTGGIANFRDYNGMYRDSVFDADSEMI